MFYLNSTLIYKPRKFRFEYLFSVVSVLSLAACMSTTPVSTAPVGTDLTVTTLAITPLPTQNVVAEVDRIQTISLKIAPVSQRMKNLEGDDLYNQCVNISLAMVINYYGLYKISDSHTPERLALDIRKKMMLMDRTLGENSGITASNILDFIDKYYPTLVAYDKGGRPKQIDTLNDKAGGGPVENRYFLVDLAGYLQKGIPVIAYVHAKNLREKGDVMPYAYNQSIGHAIVIKGIVKEDNQWFVEVNDPLIIPIQSVFYTYESLLDATINYIVIQPRT